MTNRELIERCNCLSAELRKKEKEIVQLKAELNRYTAAETTTDRTEANNSEKEETTLNSGSRVTIPEEIKIGAAVIGKLVIKSAELSNRLTAGGETRYRELVNLILGQTEVAKAKIYELAVSSTEKNEKYAAMRRCYAESADYFESVMQQIGDSEK